MENLQWNGVNGERTQAEGRTARVCEGVVVHLQPEPAEETVPPVAYDTALQVVLVASALKVCPRITLNEQLHQQSLQHLQDLGCVHGQILTNLGHSVVRASGRGPEGGSAAC